MTERRTRHGVKRHADAARPTEEAAQDRVDPTEIYRDRETGYYIFVGQRGRTHVFTPDGRHHTSFRTSRSNRIARVTKGKWNRIEKYQLPEPLR
ncbi:MAG: hypothetical protein HY314_03875 [Acidobacteria bacterium]|nr:hypothetical protein [Acidobacteriota bacterium]